MAPPKRRTSGPASRAADPLAAVELRACSELRRHPEAGMLPAIAEESYRSLRADIERRELLVPLEVSQAGVVLDGHLRLRAARDLGLDRVPVRVVTPPDEVEYMLLAALQRRQLSASQRAALAVELDHYRELQKQARTRRLANLAPGSAEVATLPPQGKTREVAAAWAGVSPRTVQDAGTVKAADPVLFEQVKQGKLPAARAARQVRQRARDAELPQAVPLPDGQFDLIYADPPWQMAGRPDSSRAVENHYPTMPLDQIKAIPVPAAANALLFLWAVNSLLPEALDVIDAWGFTYRTQFVWVKDHFGLGRYNRTQHELLLVALRGKRPQPPDRCFSSVIEAPRGRHSEKPAKVYELLESMYPRARKLELFKRGRARTGWTVWGNEASNG